jgi:hypothetical protein
MFDKRTYILVIVFVSFILFSCSYRSPSPPEDFVQFRIAGVNITDKDGNYFSAHKSTEINMFEFILAYSSNKEDNPFYPDIFMLRHPLKFDNNTKRIALVDLVTDKDYCYMINKDARNIKPDENNPNLKVFNLYDFYQTRFLKREGNFEYPLEEIGSMYSNQYNQNRLDIKTGHSSDLILSYKFQGVSVADIEVEFKSNNQTPFITPIGTKILNYAAQWNEIAHFNSNNDKSVDNMLNIVVMADKYLKDDLAHYQGVVTNMVSELKNNNFFRAHWDNINIFRLDTISLQVHDIIGVNNSALLGDNDRIKKIINASFVGSPILLDNIDAIVIVVKNSPFNYTQTYDGEIGKRNGQPINIIVTPGGNLAHLLGHALARLQDECDNACNFWDTNNGTRSYPATYQQKYRNISSIGEGFKWQKFVDDSNYQKATIFQNGLGTKDYPTTAELYYGGYNTYNIPTKYSVMGLRDSFNQQGTQFGPVNFYHLEASFRIRTGMITGGENVKEQEYTGGIGSYEWKGYSIDDFKNDYRPSFFNED